MSTERKFSKLMAIATNYDIPQPGIDSVKTVFSYNTPTLYDGLEFGEFGPLPGTDPEYTEFMVYGITLAVQVTSDQPIDVDIYQSNTNTLINDLSLTLPANQNFVKLSLGLTPKEGLSHNQSFYAKVTQAVEPDDLAEGAEISYVLARV
jgi:hypothetical protein